MKRSAIKDPAVIDTALKELVASLAETRDPALVEGFLRSLLTPAEVEEIATRWALVRQIHQGVPQREIARQYGLSLCKITRGSRELKKPESPFQKMIELHAPPRRTRR